MARWSECQCWYRGSASREHMSSAHPACSASTGVFIDPSPVISIRTASPGTSHFGGVIPTASLGWRGDQVVVVSTGASGAALRA